MDFIQGISKDMLVVAAAAGIYLLFEFGLDIVKELLVDRIKRKRTESGKDEWGGDDEEA